MSSIGSRIRDLRVAKGLTQTALSGRGISAGYVSLVESGKRTPSDEMVARFAERLGVAVDELVPDRPAPSSLARAEVNFARLALANGNPAEALRCVDSLSPADLDGPTACDAELVLAESLQQLGHLDRAVETLETLLPRCRKEGAWLALCVGATALTVMYLNFGDMSRAIDTATSALNEVESAGLSGTDEHLRLGATLVAASFERGDVLHSTHLIERLIRVADRVGSTRARGSIYWNAANVAHGRGRIEDSIRLTDRAIALLGEQEESRDLPRLRIQYAWLLLHRDIPMPEEALVQLDRAENDPALVGARLDVGAATVLRGRAYLLLGSPDDAAEHAARALQLLGPTDHVDRASALLLLGDVGAAQYNDDLSSESYREMELVLRGMQPSREVARLWRSLGDSLRTIGNIDAAVSAYDSSLSLLGLTLSPTASRLRVA
jgi:transcriptional regulator with XRE-family HTH domain